MISISAHAVELSDYPAISSLTPEETEFYVRRIQECNENIGDNVIRINVANFNVAIAGREFMNSYQSCKNLSLRTAENVTSDYLQYLKSAKFSKLVSCLEYRSPENPKKNKVSTFLQQLIQDPTNLGVFSARYVGKEPLKEACTLLHIRIYRKSGVQIDLYEDLSASYRSIFR